MNYEERYTRLNNKLGKINNKLNDMLLDNFMILQNSSKNLTEETDDLQQKSQTFNELTKNMEVS